MKRNKELVGTYVLLESDEMLHDEALLRQHYDWCLKKMNTTHKNLSDIKVVMKNSYEIGGPLNEFCSYGVKARGYRRYNFKYFMFYLFCKKLKLIRFINLEFSNYYRRW